MTVVSIRFVYQIKKVCYIRITFLIVYLFFCIVATLNAFLGVNVYKLHCQIHSTDNISMFTVGARSTNEFKAEYNKDYNIFILNCVAIRTVSTQD